MKGKVAGIMDFFVLHNNTQEGPFATTDVKRQLREGRYAPETLCWREGWEDWRPLSSVIGLVAKSSEEEGQSASDEQESGKNKKKPRPPVDWQPSRPRNFNKSVVVLVVGILMLAALCIVLAVLLLDSYSHMEHQTEPAVSRATLEQAILEASANLRGPQLADEIRVWATYEDASTRRPTAISRANVLIYPEEMVAGVVQNLTQGSTPDLLAGLQSSLPPPWRETITDTSGVASVGGLKPGKYIVLVFAQKISATETENYCWIAKRQLDGHPSQSLVLSEKNATTPKSVDILVIE